MNQRGTRRRLARQPFAARIVRCDRAHTMLNPKGGQTPIVSQDLGTGGGHGHRARHRPARQEEQTDQTRPRNAQPIRLFSAMPCVLCSRVRQRTDPSNAPTAPILRCCQPDPSKSCHRSAQKQATPRRTRGVAHHRNHVCSGRPTLSRPTRPSSSRRGRRGAARGPGRSARGHAGGVLARPHPGDVHGSTRSRHGPP